MIVRQKSTGLIGSLPDDQFDSKLYEVVNATPNQAPTAPPPATLAEKAVNYLPAIGGIGGGIVGGMAAGGFGSVPGAALGAGAGEYLKEKLQGKPISDTQALAQTLTGLGNNKDIRNQQALSAGGELVGLGVGKILNKAGELVTKNLPEKMMEGVFKEPMKATKAAIKGGETLGQEALKHGEVGTAEKLYTQALTKTNALEDTLQALLSNSDKVVTSDDLLKTVTPLVDEYTKAGNKSAADAILTRIQDIISANGDAIPASVANQVKRSLYDEVRRSYGAQAGAGVEGIKAIARGIKESLANIPGVDPINQELSYTGRIANSLADKIARTGRNNLISLTDAILGAGGFAGAGPAGLLPVIAKKAADSTLGQTAMATGLSKVGSVLPDIAQAAGKVGQVGARALFSGVQANQGENQQGNPEQQSVNHIPPIIQPLSTDVTQPETPLPDIVTITNKQTGETKQVKRSELAQYGIGGEGKPTGLPTTDDIYAKIVEDMSTTGGKNYGRLKSLYDLATAQEKRQGGGQMSAQGKIKYMQANMAESIVNQLDNMYHNIRPTITGQRSGQITGALQNIGVATKTNKEASIYDATAKGNIEALARGLSGQVGVMREEERKAALEMLPTLYDPPALAEAKLQSLRNLIAMQKQAASVDIGSVDLTQPENTLPDITGGY